MIKISISCNMSNSKPKIVGIVGSGRKNSNSKKLLTVALESAESLGCETKIVDILDLNFSECRACNNCALTGKCVISDELSSLFAALDGADAVIISTPVYFYGMPGKLKLFVDRFQMYWARRYKLGIEPKNIRPGGLISIAGSKGAKSFDGIILTIKYFYLIQGIELATPLLFSEWDGMPENLPQDFLQKASVYGEQIALRITLGNK